MRNNEVIFDRAHRRIAFVPSDCGAMHAACRDTKNSKLGDALFVENRKDVGRPFCQAALEIESH